MTRIAAPVFIDTGAWIALAVTRDVHHIEATSIWAKLERSGAKLYTSVPIVIETFTFLDRNTQRNVALGWRRALDATSRLRLWECTRADLEVSWKYFERPDLHRLSAVDATSFAIMERTRLKIAFTFDHHFAMVGFRAAG